MPITYAGVSLLLEDPGHLFDVWLDQVLSLQDTRLWGDAPVAERAGNWNCAGNEAPRIGLPSPNWPVAPRMKLNSLWWPTGASRWARGLFLIDDGGLAKILKAIKRVDGSYGKGYLELKDSTHTKTVTAEMYLLSPRPVTFTPPATAQSDQHVLWLLPLVDVRYLWQFYDGGDLSEVETWQGLITKLKDALRLDGDIAHNLVFDDYGIPDPLEMCRSYENAAVLLDAAAYSLGARVLRTHDGAVSLMTGLESGDTLETNFRSTNTDTVMAGDCWLEKRVNVLPRMVRVAFPVYWNRKREPSYGVYVADNSTAETQGRQDPYNILTVFTSAGAIFTGSGDEPDTSGDPDNKAEIDALAEAITLDYATYISDLYDLSYHGIATHWTLSGLDDYIWIHWGYQQPMDSHLLGEEAEQPILGDYAAFTRIASMPANVFVPSMYHQFADVELSEEGDWYQVLTDMDGDETYLAYANPGYFDSETGFLADPHALDENPINSAWTVLLVDGSGQVPCWAGDWVRAESLPFVVEGYEDYDVKLVTSRVASQLTFWGELTEALAYGSSAGASVLINGVTHSKTVWDGGLMTSGGELPENTIVRVAYDLATRLFYVVGAPCYTPT